MKYLFHSIKLFIFFILSIHAQFPLEDYIYKSNFDTGMDQYQTSSLKNSQTISLTFDDGPHPTRTNKILNLLKEYNMKATFFILTEKINNKTKHILKRIIDEGHTIASHHENHSNNNIVSENIFSKSLSTSINKINSLKIETDDNQQEIYYRFPYGAYGKNKNYHHMNVIRDRSKKIFNKNCINFVFWDIDSNDWLNISSKQIAQNIISNIEGGEYVTFKLRRRYIFWGDYVRVIVKQQINNPIGGGVVLMHDIHEKSIDALEILLGYIDRNNIRVQTLQEIREYSYNGKTCNPLFQVSI